jgi:type I restriction enzyme S subunit
MKRPSIRFLEFNDEWKIQSFGDYVSECKEMTSDKEKYPLYSLTIEKGVIPKPERYEREHLITKAGDAYKIVPPNAFVYNPMNLRFGALKVNHENFSVCVSGYYDVFFMGDEETLKFWENYLLTDRILNHYYSIATGSLIEKLRVHFSQFVNIKRLLPSLAEQKKISNFFKNIDDVISAIEIEVVLWEEKKKGVMQKIFSQKVRFKKEDGSEYPKWKKVKLYTLCSKVGSGKTPKGGKQVYQSDGIMLIRSQNVHNRRLLINNAIYISDEINNTMLSTVVEENDVLLNITGASIGRCCLYNMKKRANVNQHVCIIRIKDWNIAEPLYIVDYILSDYFQNQINILQNGGSREGLNFQQIENMDVVLPSIEEQRCIANTITNLNAVIKIKQQKLEVWKNIKKGLLQQMFV